MYNQRIYINFRQYAKCFHAPQILGQEIYELSIEFFIVSHVLAGKQEKVSCWGQCRLLISSV